MPRRSSAAGDVVLSTRSLNRALLARQLLLKRARKAPLDALEHLVGLQAQAPLAPYYGLWLRLEDFRPERLAALLVHRTAVRIALMRSTIHLVSARDALQLRAVTQPALDRELKGSRGKQLAGVDRDAVTAAARALLDERPLTFTQLGEELEKRFPTCSAWALAGAARSWLALVQVPPRGVWGQAGPAAHATVEKWLGASVVEESDPAPLVLRYLKAFGPATVADVQAFTGLTRLRDVVERLRPQLRTFRDEQRRELLDVTGAPLPDGDEPAPPRFLPEFDNVLVAYADRTRVIPDAHRPRLAARNGMVPGTVLVDGCVRASWRLRRGRGPAAVQVQTFEPLAPDDRTAVEEEALRLLAFAAPGERHAVEFA